ncbi:molecular chaperone DnaJ [Halobiforma lacisalsi AJ5]|uniref:Chaperone protein DnaJ n=1 Tax=Natronobacterium lacisalsi AJ5 TaxID=358396 RepID=M0LKA6_NATLA|nr:DnaJ domain-containing protein [Halobiforma lacisalsi]APW98586.1 molecular chaperone DnaJ [Halobiforma lacisalsi AJ5]EMA32445.1 chaperone protein DnaJ [Halobiforma lacisalsi AJ5]
MTDDFYDLLEIPSDASQDEIKEAYREKVRVYHPDVNDDDRARAQFTAVKKAYDILGDPVERQAYDRLGHENYVAKRTSGIPSPDVWSSDSGSDGASSSTTGSTTSTSSSGSTAETSRTGTSSSSGGRTRTKSRTGSTSGTGSTGSAGSGAASTSASSRSRTDSSGSSSASDRASGTAGTKTESAAGTGTENTTATSDGGTTANAAAGTAGAATNRSGTSKTTTGTGTGTGTDSDNAVLSWWRRRNFSLPLIWASLLVYLTGIVQFALANRSALEAVVADATAVGADPGALWAYLTTSRHGVETMSEFVVGFEPVSPPLEPPGWYAALAGIVGVAVVVALVDRVVRREDTWGTISIDETILFALALGAAATLAGGPVLAGAVLMPFLFTVIVHRTRLGPGWKPSYLYVLPVLAPVTGITVGTAGVVGEVTLVVDLLAYVVLPLAGALGLPLRATIRKHFDR